MYEEWLHTTQAREATAAASVPAATAAASVPAPSSLDGSNRFMTLKAAVPPSWLDANALAADAVDVASGPDPDGPIGGDTKRGMK